MQMTQELEGGITTMCNVSQGIAERAFNDGISQGISRGISQGISQGKIDAYLEMVREVLISITDAAKKLSLTEQEILDMIKTEK